MSTVKVRFPPSPTGYCHVGTARMALLNYLFARKHGGTIVFRSEDTDRERSTREFEEDIVENIKWLGLSWDEFLRQSERTPLYTAALEKLIADDKAYISKEPSKKDETVMVSVVRLKNSGKTVTFDDIVRGHISFDTTELGDFVIARAIDDPLYHLSVVVDDAENGITHVIRGEEHISNTPRQILIQEALGYTRPQYAHYPLFLGADRSKLSKRKGDVAVKEYRGEGYLPQALLNFIGTLGWTPPSGREILSLDEMIQEFELTDLHKSGAVFDIDKLRWYNREYLMKLSEDSFASHALQRIHMALAAKGVHYNETIARKILGTLKERVSTWGDIDRMVEEGEIDFFFTSPTLTAADLPGKDNDNMTASRHLSHILRILEQSGDEIFLAPERLKDTVWEYASREGRGAVLWPMRYALSGRAKSPDPFTIAYAIGKEETLSRIRVALHILES